MRGPFSTDPRDYVENPNLVGFDELEVLHGFMIFFYWA